TRIAAEQGPQNAGFLFEAPLAFRPIQEALDACRAVEPLTRPDQRVEGVEQRDPVFHSRRIEELYDAGFADSQLHALHASRGARAVAHFTEFRIAAQCAQQRCLAGVGMPDNRQAQCSGRAAIHGLALLSGATWMSA